MTSQINRQYQLAQRPSGLPGRDTFSFVETPLGEPAEGQILVKNEYLSLDPAMRGWMNDARSYIPPVGIGEVMRALGVGKVLVSKHPGFQTGDYVNGALGVQDYFVGEPKGFYKVDPSRAPLPRYLSALGMTGMTAYFALLDVGQPKSGETVVISGAAGAVGSVAGQIARLKGCRVVGIAGGAEKCRFLVEELLRRRHRLQERRPRRRTQARMPEGHRCVLRQRRRRNPRHGAHPHRLQGTHRPLRGDQPVNNKEAVRGPANYLSLLVNRARMEGMVVMDYAQRFPEGLKEMATWLAEGKLQSREDIVEGLGPSRNAAQAVQRGKLRQVGVEGLRSAAGAEEAADSASPRRACALKK